MIGKALMVFILTGLIVAFIFYGLPQLERVKEAPPKKTVASEPINAERVLDMDISIESMCVNMVTGEQYIACNEENCDSTCRTEGCRFFGLNYLNYSYEGKCVCLCYEENKIKKALSVS